MVGGTTRSTRGRGPVIWLLALHAALGLGTVAFGERLGRRGLLVAAVGPVVTLAWLAGAALTFLAALGTVRFRDVFARMHALSKASTLGLLLILLGAALALDHPNDITSRLLAAVLHVVTSPIGANLISRATYFAEGIPNGIDTIDELAGRAGPSAG